MGRGEIVTHCQHLPQALAQLSIRRFQEAHHIEEIDAETADGRADFSTAIQQGLPPEFGEGRRSLEYFGHRGQTVSRNPAVTAVTIWRLNSSSASESTGGLPVLQEKAHENGECR
jgi:hypothetical protein